MRNLPVSQIMTRPLVTVAPDAKLEAAKALMEQRRVHHLVVVEKNRMVGILSSADLSKVALLQRPEELGSTRLGPSLDLDVRDVMVLHVAVLRESASLKDAAQALALGGFHALPVLALDDSPVGIVTSSDLLEMLVDQIEREPSSGNATATTAAPPDTPLVPRLLEVLRAAEVYLHSGQSDQQHAQLTRAVERAREFRGGDSSRRL
jgi:CBS domain-containing protein